MRHTSFIGIVLFLLALPGCLHPAAEWRNEPVPVPLPDNAKSAPDIAALDFLTGQWVAVNPNKTVNEETWSAPRGNVLIGSFRQVRLDGDCSFVEMSQIALEHGKVILRLRHMHGRLEIPEGREEVSLFELVSLDEKRVEFRGTAGSDSVASVVYERVGPYALDQSIAFAPETKQPPFVTHYSRYQIHE